MSLGGIFAEWQPRYEECGIATFPVREKRPAVRGYLKLGTSASKELAIRFPSDNAFGFACRRSGITVLDIDAPDERLLADALSEFGATPLIVRSGSGHFQAWYRHSGERRRVRPDPGRPIDILGDGFVVAPPSKSAKGSYSIIEGSLDDLGQLPAMRGPPSSAEPTSPAPVPIGRRNTELWRSCMAAARQCRSISELWSKATQMNATALYEPLPDEEVLRVVASAWAKECSGENWFGRGGRVILKTDEIDGLLLDDPDGFLLLTVLRRHHSGAAEFAVANAMCATMPGRGWTRQRFAAARSRLVSAGYILELRPASHFHGPAIYRLKGVEN